MLFFNNSNSIQKKNTHKTTSMMTKKKNVENFLLIKRHIKPIREGDRKEWEVILIWEWSLVMGSARWTAWLVGYKPHSLASSLSKGLAWFQLFIEHQHCCHLAFIHWEVSRDPLETCVLPQPSLFPPHRPKVPEPFKMSQRRQPSRASLSFSKNGLRSLDHLPQRE